MARSPVTRGPRTVLDGHGGHESDVARGKGPSRAEDTGYVPRRSVAHAGARGGCDDAPPFARFEL